MIEFINLLQIWKDQGAIQPSGLLEDHDLQALINKMRFEAENLPISDVRISLPSIEDVKEEFQEETQFVGGHPIDFYSISVCDEQRLIKFIEWIQGKRDSF